MMPPPRPARLVSRAYEAKALEKARRQQRFESIVVGGILVLFAACVIGVVAVVVWGSQP